MNSGESSPSGGGQEGQDSIGYSFDNSVPPHYSEAIKAALDAWSEQSLVKFEKCMDSQWQHCVTFRFVQPNHGDMAPFSFLNNALAHTVFYGPHPAEVHFNKEKLLQDGLRVRDVFQVALHEIGHVIGVPHSSDEQSIMYPDRRKGNFEQEILSSDLERFAHLHIPR